METLPEIEAYLTDLNKRWPEGYKVSYVICWRAYGRVWSVSVVFTRDLETLQSFQKEYLFKPIKNTRRINEPGAVNVLRTDLEYVREWMEQGTWPYSKESYCALHKKSKRGD